MDNSESQQKKCLLCSTVYVINGKGQFLLLDHKKLGKWVPPGGKVESFETPDTAAYREVLEETGLKIQLIGERTLVEGGLERPWGSQLCPINDAFEHYDLVYLGIPLKGETFILNEKEANGIDWFTLEEIDALETFDSVKQWCKFFSEVDLSQYPTDCSIIASAV